MGRLQSFGNCSGQFFLKKSLALGFLMFLPTQRISPMKMYSSLPWLTSKELSRYLTASGRFLSYKSLNLKRRRVSVHEFLEVNWYIFLVVSCLENCFQEIWGFPHTPGHLPSYTAVGSSSYLSFPVSSVVAFQAQCTRSLSNNRFFTLSDGRATLVRLIGFQQGLAIVF